MILWKNEILSEFRFIYNITIMCYIFVIRTPITKVAV